MTRVTILHRTPVLVGHTLLLPGETHDLTDGALQAAIAQYGEAAFRTPTVQAAIDSGKKGDSDDDDDLTAIKGIGPAIQKALAAQGIHTFAELAAANPAELAAATQGSEKQVEAWRSEAQERLQGEKS